MVEGYVYFVNKEIFMPQGLVAVAVMIMCLLGYGLGAYAGWNQGYYDGQVDAINGTIKYELVTQKDGTSNWSKKQ